MRSLKSYLDKWLFIVARMRTYRKGKEKSFFRILSFVCSGEVLWKFWGLNTEIFYIGYLLLLLQQMV